MQVVILCGGLGTRLREETEFRPKPMVNIGSRPVLWHIMKIFAHYGFNEFVLCLGYKGEMIKEYFFHYELMSNDVTIELGRPEKIIFYPTHNEIGWKITLANTGENALKGARLKKIEKYIKGDMFLMTYGDGVADVDIHKLISFHQKHNKLVTVTGVVPTSQFGELKMKGNRVDSFFEKPKSVRRLINGGFFVMNRKIFRYLSPDDQSDLEVGPLEKIAGKGQLMVYKHKGSWACMDTYRDMQYLNGLWANNQAFWKCWRE